MSLMNQVYGSRAGVGIKVGNQPLMLNHLSAVVAYVPNNGNTGVERIDVRDHEYRVDVFSTALFSNASTLPTQSLRVSGNDLPLPIGLNPQPVVVGNKTHYYPDPTLKHGTAPNPNGGATIDAYKLTIAFTTNLVLPANSDNIVMLQTEHDSATGFVYLLKADNFFADGMQAMPEGYRISSSAQRIGPISTSQTYALRFGTAAEILGEVPLDQAAARNSLKLLPAGSNQVHVLCETAERGFLHEIFYSPDLQSWSRIRSFAGTGTDITFPAPSGPRGYFRKRLTRL